MKNNYSRKKLFKYVIKHTKDNIHISTNQGMEMQMQYVVE